MKKLLSADEDGNLWWLLSQTAHAMFDARARELAQYGIRPTQAAVLLAIRTIGNKATPAEVSRWLFREPHSVSGILKRMEKDELVKEDQRLREKELDKSYLDQEGTGSLSSVNQDRVHASYSVCAI